MRKHYSVECPFPGGGFNKEESNCRTDLQRAVMRSHLQSGPVG
jgi:hypothetical protein